MHDRHNPCIHDNDDTCYPTFPGTNVCPPGTGLCDGDLPDPGPCGTCASSSSGPCQDAQHTCYPYSTGTTCPSGTVACGSVNPSSVANDGDFALLSVSLSGTSSNTVVENKDKVEGALQSLLPGNDVTVLYVRVLCPRGLFW